MTAPMLDQVCCASLPLPALTVLAGLRREGGIRVAKTAGRAWVFWEPGDVEVLNHVLPVAGVELFVRSRGRWHRPGRHLPESGLPVSDEECVPIDRAIFPEAVTATAARADSFTPARLRLVADDTYRPATALRCRLTDFARWAEWAPASRLAAIRAARSGERVMVVGAWLPEIADATRFWGERILTPLGFCPEPRLGERALRRALRIGDDETLVLAKDRFEIMPDGVLQPPTRAGVRMALREDARP
jgi:hypothetical protein